MNRRAHPHPVRSSSGPTSSLRGEVEDLQGEVEDPEGEVEDLVGEAEQIFAANRAHGFVALSLAGSTRGTVCIERREEGSLRARFPATCADAAMREAVLINTAGGIAGGDRLAVALDLAAGARLCVTTAAAEKVYRSLGPDSCLDVSATIADGAELAWLPQETILFDRARLKRSVEIRLEPRAALLFAEIVVFGRAAMGEVVAKGALVDRWRIRRGGRLAFADNLRFEGAIAEELGEAAVAKGHSAIGTLLLIPGDDAAVAAMREAEPALCGETGFSFWNGLALARLAAPDGMSARHDLAVILRALGRRLPRFWLN